MHIPGNEEDLKRTLEVCEIEERSGSASGNEIRGMLREAFRSEGFGRECICEEMKVKQNRRERVWESTGNKEN